VYKKLPQTGDSSWFYFAFKCEMARRWKVKTRKIVSAIAAVLLAITAAQAGVIPDRWEKLEALPSGTAVIVKLRGGERLESAFNTIGPEEISFIEPNGKERRLPRSAVLRIETAAVVRDRLCNGTLIGALIGVAGGITSIVLYANAKTNGPVYWDEDGGAYLFGAALVGGGIGAATGAIVDAAVKHHEMLYQARGAIKAGSE
jgi:hypothetical protein